MTFKKVQADSSKISTLVHNNSFIVSRSNTTNIQVIPEPENYQLKESKFAHDFTKTPVQNSRTYLPIQTKLTIGKAGDRYEEEADSVGHQVVQQINSPQSGKTIQRDLLPEEEEMVLMKPISGYMRRQQKPEELIKKTTQVGIIDETSVPADLEASIQQSRGNGQALSNDIRKPMEQAFGFDFSKVKVHSDAKSDQLNQSIQAKAFTTGQDIFFRQGEYNPQSHAGKELIAHELTHVVQQHDGVIQRAILKTKPKLKSSSDPIYTWKLSGNLEGNYIDINEVEPSAMSDRTWLLTLRDRDGEKKGHISIFYYSEQKILKPDGLEVPGNKQGLGYGAALGQYAVIAMRLPVLRQLTSNAEKISLNLVNPLSAHISMKELNINLNRGEDLQNSVALDQAKIALEANKKESKLYKRESFPTFWGRLVSLAKINNVKFLSVLGEWDSQHEFSQDDANKILNLVLSSKAGTFGLNIEAPISTNLD